MAGGATFCHFSEEYLKVDYRKYKNINIYIEKDNNRKIKKKYLYYARKKNFENNWKKCEKELIKNSLIKKYIFPENNYQVLKMNTFKVTNFLISKIKKNRLYLVK